MVTGMRWVAALVALFAVGSVSAQTPEETSQAPGGVVRVLDKVSGELTDLEIFSGEAQAAGRIQVTLQECRYPAENPSGDAYAFLTISVRGATKAAYQGWMIASAPALNPLDHPRYDVWVLRCMIS
ncbi:DUF2155 domain-containing protein [Aestuariibius sp. 2305UL40-4]|uniref:DUF2155 domain-containing protein n=1 Tax=Aestuariibius violaceus TaxID=3234132 RepID=UPI003491029B